MKRISLFVTMCALCISIHAQDAELNQKVSELEARIQNLEKSLGKLEQLRNDCYMGNPITTFTEDNIKFDVISAEMNENTGEIEIQIQIVNTGVDKYFRLNNYIFLDSKQVRQSKNGYNGKIKGEESSVPLAQGFLLTRNDPHIIILYITDTELPDYVKNLMLDFSTSDRNRQNDKRFKDKQFKDFEITKK